jgi:hypothetical protein
MSARRGRYKRQVRKPIGPPDPAACERHKDLIAGLELILKLSRRRLEAMKQSTKEPANAKNQAD